MSVGFMTLLIFSLIALLGSGTTALVLLIAKRVREVKEREHTGEAVKLRSEPIKIGPVPVGQRKTAKIAMRTGSHARVAYQSGDPSKAILVDNTGLMNEQGEYGTRSARGDVSFDLPHAAPQPAVQIHPDQDSHYLKSTLRRILIG